MAATLTDKEASRREDLVAFNERLATAEGREPFAERMRLLRDRAGHSQYTCAHALGVDQPTYRHMERNEIRFRRRDLVALAALYKMKLHEAFPGAV